MPGVFLSGPQLLFESCCLDPQLGIQFRKFELRISFEICRDDEPCFSLKMTRADQGRKKNELLLIVGCVPNAGMPAAHPVPSLRDKRSPGDEKRPGVSCLTWIS